MAFAVRSMRLISSVRYLGGSGCGRSRRARCTCTAAGRRATPIRYPEPCHPSPRAAEGRTRAVRVPHASPLSTESGHGGVGESEPHGLRSMTCLLVNPIRPSVFRCASRRAGVSTARWSEFHGLLRCHVLLPSRPRAASATEQDVRIPALNPTSSDSTAGAGPAAITRALARNERCPPVVGVTGNVVSDGNANTSAGGRRLCSQPTTVRSDREQRVTQFHRVWDRASVLLQLL